MLINFLSVRYIQAEWTMNIFIFSQRITFHFSMKLAENGSLFLKLIQEPLVGLYLRETFSKEGKLNARFWVSLEISLIIHPQKALQSLEQNFSWWMWVEFETV